MTTSGEKAIGEWCADVTITAVGELGLYRLLDTLPAAGASASCSTPESPRPKSHYVALPELRKEPLCVILRRASKVRFSASSPEIGANPIDGRGAASEVLATLGLRLGAFIFLAGPSVHRLQTPMCWQVSGGGWGGLRRWRRWGRRAGAGRSRSCRDGRGREWCR